MRLFHTVRCELDARARRQMATALARQHKTAQAIAHYNEALRLKPNFADAMNNPAWIRAGNAEREFRDDPEAVRLAERACDLTGYKKPMLIGTLAAPYAEAATTAQRACTLATEEGDGALLARNQQLLELYRAGKPYHEPTPGQGEF